MGDRIQLQQVLLNLILNACDAMRNVATSDRRLAVNVDGSESHVRFTIRDSGSGIPHELMQRLFEPFVTSKPEGLGLGLSISRTIIAAHGGRLWAQNNAHAGATLCFQLPAAAPVPYPDLVSGMGATARITEHAKVALAT